MDADGRAEMVRSLEHADLDDVVWLVRALSDDRLIAVLRVARGKFDERRLQAGGVNR